MKLLAYSADERYAFVRDGDRIVHVRPPFDSDKEVTESAVERAVTVYGFQACEREFETREALVAFLGEESVRAWREAHPGEELPSVDELRRRLLAMRTP